MNINKRQHSLGPDSIPEGNILDLRQVQAKRQPSPDGNDALREFWKEQSKKKKSLAESRKTGEKSSRHVPRRSLADIRMAIKAMTLRLRPGSFPVVALGLLLVLGGGIAISSVIGLQSRVVAIAHDGVAKIKIATAKAESRDMTGASASFQEAADVFANAQHEFESLNPVIEGLASHLPYTGSKIKSGRSMLAAATKLSTAASDLASIAQPLASDSNGFSGPSGLIDRLQEDTKMKDKVVAEIDSALNDLSQVDPDDLPESYRSSIQQVHAAIPGLRASVGSLTDAVNVLSDLLGSNEPKEHLFVFQNSNELRPTGGFIGSFALIKMDHGSFHILDAPDKGSFSVDLALPDTITPPLPLQVITPSWYFRDANWYPDFPTTARQLSQMYNQARGFAPRNVVAVTNQFLEHALEVTGPVELPDYGVTVNATNVTEITQDQVEHKYDLRTNDPKRFVVDLVPVIASKLSSLSVTSYPKFLAVIAESVVSGDLQVWSTDQNLEDAIVRLGWSGKMTQPSFDGLQLVDTNVGGGKTDGVVTEDIHQTLTVADDGTVTERVTVQQRHNGTAGDIFTSDRNRTYHRFYVPQGSRFISAEGFDNEPASAFQTLPIGSTLDPLLRSTEGRVVVDEQTGTRMNDEFGFTVFGNWTEIDPGQSKTFTMTYVLPKKVTDTLARYDFALGKQSGAKNRTFTLDVIVPETSKIEWSSDANAKLSPNGLEWSLPIEHDTKFSFVIRSKKP